MSDKETVNYEDLKSDLDRKWAEHTALVKTEIEILHKKIAEMPDVKNAPEIGSITSFGGVKCAKCESDQFVVIRYVTINGIRHRAELECTDEKCKFLATYDFNEAIWMIG